MSESTNIKVICRVRPLNQTEQTTGSKFIINVPQDNNTSLSISGKTFTFDRVISTNATQTDVYDVVAKPIVTDILNGYNGTIFAYGQTASGKTFTMEGLINDSTHQGIIPRIIHDMFNHIYQMDSNLEFHIKVSYFEIYLDKIRDLLDINKTNLAVHEDQNRVPYVKGATERFVTTPEEVFEAIEDGKANRHVAVTNMNEHSSRSHSVFMIQLRQENVETQKTLSGKLCLVDLAGSEKVSKTGAEGAVLDEAKNINRSLSSLGNVINALVEGSSHVPYRDSKLTRILQESLGGNARTTMVICCSPAAFNESETKSTLLFGMRAKTIKNCVTVNEELTADEWRRRYERERDKNKRLNVIVSKLEAELKKWRGGEAVGQSDWFNESMYKTVLEDEKALPTSTSDLTLSSIADTSSVGVKKLVTGSGDNVEELYKQLDDKDEEINKQAQIIAQLEQQMEEQDLFAKNYQKDLDKIQTEKARLEAENDSSKEEAKEVLQALEELAINYDEKTREIEVKSKEVEEFQDNLNRKENLIRTMDTELQQMKENYTLQKKKHTEMMGSLIKELGDIGEALNDQLTKPALAGAEKIDEEFTVMRLFISKMKTEAKTLQSRVKQLDEDRTHQTTSIKKYEEEVNNLGIKVQEYEKKINTLNESVEEATSSKRQLEETIDKLNTEVAKLRANEELIVSSGAADSKQILATQSDIKAKLDEEFKKQSEQYALQVKQLRDEVATKQKLLEDIKDNVNHLTLQNEKLSEQNTGLLKDNETKTHKLDALQKQTEMRQQAEQDIKSLEETVLKELRTLHNLRKLFVEDLQNRIKKSAARAAASANGDEEDMEDEDLGGSVIQKERIAFLENNLEQLTKVHKQLVRDNSDLRLELPKLEKRLKATMERVKALESALKEAKESAMRDRKRYQHEVDRIKEAVRQRSVARRGNQPQIVKPIRAGQVPMKQPSISGGGGAAQ